MTELEIEREGYRYMVALFSIALIGAIVLCVHFYSNQKAKVNYTLSHENTYATGWADGYLRAIRATNAAIVKGDTTPLLEFEKALKTDLIKFRQQNNLE